MIQKYIPFLAVSVDVLYQTSSQASIGSADDTCGQRLYGNGVPTVSSHYALREVIVLIIKCKIEVIVES
jgi:hypothetical protein